MILRVCRCGKIIDANKKMCDKCSKQADLERKKSYKRYDRYKRDKKSQEFYHSYVWVKFVRIVTQRDGGLCKICESKGVLQKKDVVHHIVELAEDRGKGLDPNNCICLCNSCHGEVHTAYRKGKKEKELMQTKLRDIIGGIN